jgi:type III secretory pathway component EscS
MDIDALIRMCQDSMWTVLIVIAPVVLVSAGVGLLIAILEAVTSIQDQTIGMAARLVGVLVLLLMFGGTIGNVVHRYVDKQFSTILLVGRPVD